MFGGAGMVAYATAKAGVVGLTNASPATSARDNIRVNAIAPGAVMTERQRRLWYTTRSIGRRDGRSARRIKTTLLGEEIARAALFLAADDSRMITKQCSSSMRGCAERGDVSGMRIFVFGLNPYGLTYHLGLARAGRAARQSAGRRPRRVHRASPSNSAPARIEIFDPWLRALSDDELAALRERLAGLGMTPIVSSGLMMGPFESALRSARALGATTIRFGLTTVLCGDRHALGDSWRELVDERRARRSAIWRRAPPTKAGRSRSRTIRISAATNWSRSARTTARASASASTPATRFPVAEAPLDFTARDRARTSAMSISRTIACSSPTRAIGWCAAPSATARCRSPRCSTCCAEHHAALTAVARARRARGAACAPADAGLVARLCAEVRAGARRLPRGGAPSTGCRTTPTTARRGSAATTARARRLRTRHDPPQRRQHARARLDATEGDWA